MKPHLLTGFLAAFWAVMMALLALNEAGGGAAFESRVPIHSVVERMLKAADPSTLRLSRHGIALGQLRWLPSVREVPLDTNSVAPEGMVAAATGYHIDLDLTLSGSNPDSRWYAVGQLDLDLEYDWEEVLFRLIQRPTTWEVQAARGRDTIRFSYEEGRSEPVRKEYRLADLARLPATITPIAPLLPPGLLLSAGATNTPSLPPITWDATDSHLRVGRHRVRAYRIRGRLLEDLEIVIYISRAGELLRIELPDHYTLTTIASPTTHEPTQQPGDNPAP